MEQQSLSQTMQVKRISEDGRAGTFEIEGLYGGYGLTVGTALRRVLLSSIPGAAITQVKVRGVSHEFTTLPGVTEDIVEFMLRLKRVRLRLYTDEPQTLLLKKKGEGTVTAGDIHATSEVEIVNPDITLATLTSKGSELEAELTVERGLGYMPSEMRKAEKLPIGVIALDALFSPVTKANFSVENMRVGEKTDYNRLRLTVETDGTISPSAALEQASALLREHFAKIAEIDVQAAAPVQKAEEGGGEKPKKRAKRTRKAPASPEAEKQEEAGGE